MKRLIYSLAALFAFAFAVNAQINPELACPSVMVRGPAGIVLPGKLGTFVATVEPKDPLVRYKYTWTTSNGKIASGQGTPIIKVRIPLRQDVIAEVRVDGLPRNCPDTASERYTVDVLITPLQIAQTRAGQYRFGQRLLNAVRISANKNPHGQIYVVIGNRNDLAESKILRLRDRMRASFLPTRVDRSRFSFGVKARQREGVKIYLLLPTSPDPDVDSKLPK
jgi:hypothetical protein